MACLPGVTIRANRSSHSAPSGVYFGEFLWSRQAQAISASEAIPIERVCFNDRRTGLGTRRVSPRMPARAIQAHLLHGASHRPAHQLLRSRNPGQRHSTTTTRARQASTSAPICLPPTVLACPNTYALQVLAADSARPPAQSPLGVALERARTNQIGNNARHSSTVGQFILALRSRTIASTCSQLAGTVSALPWHCATNRSVPAGPGCSPGAGPVRSRRSSSGTLTRLSSSRRSMDRTDLSRPLSARSIGGLVEYLVGGPQQHEDLVMEGR